MREHPIPQDITSYKFHLVGNMTLKQFAECVVGAILALIIYSTNLPAFIKWPLVLGAVGLGFAVAFVPIQERPLDHWLITFFKILYKPTKFYWQKKPEIPAPFLYQSNSQQKQPENELDLSPVRRQKIQEFLKSLDQPSQQDDWTKAHNQRVDQVLQTFDQVQIQARDVKKGKQKPNLGVRVRQLSIPTSTQAQSSTPPPELAPAQVVTQQAVAQNIDSTRTPDLTPEELLEVQEQDKSIVQQTNSHQPNQSQEFRQRQASAASKAEDVDHLQVEQVTTNKDLPFPSPPSLPNKIVGMVISQNNDLLDNAIVEIKNQKGQIVRAVKTNSLGQFFISTPLADGLYLIDIDKDGYSFTTKKIELSGKKISPLEFRGQAQEDS